MPRSNRPALPAVAALAAALAMAAVAQPSLAAGPSAELIKRGRYLVHITGCNDCHTAGYAMKDGKVPESEWLKGDKLGWQGPWGTTYPANLRLKLANMTEREWLAFGKDAKLKPPMPWFNMNAMSKADLRAIYHFVRSLGPAGEPAPAYVPPGTPVKGPVVTFPAPPK